MVLFDKYDFMQVLYLVGFTPKLISSELAKQIRDLSGIANNVNQIAHQIHIDGFDAVKEQCLHIIAAISSIINQVKSMRHDS